MRIGNRTELDSARESLRDQFDAIWIASTEIGAKESRAIRCAIALDRPRMDRSNNWEIGIGWRACGSFNAVIRAESSL